MFSLLLFFLPFCFQLQVVLQCCRAKRVDSLGRQGLTFASAAVSRTLNSAEPGPPAEQEEQQNSVRRLHAVSVRLSWYSAPASSKAASLAANPASVAHMLHERSMAFGQHRWHSTLGKYCMQTVSPTFEKHCMQSLSLLFPRCWETLHAFWDWCVGKGSQPEVCQ